MMGANKTKINKTVLHQLENRTHRPPAEIKAMYEIFRRHFPNGRVESPQDLWECLKKFSLLPVAYDEATAIRLYRLFDLQRTDIGIDFFSFMVVSHTLERGNIHEKVKLYFDSLDVDGNRLITREDLEASLPRTVEAPQLIQQLLKQWDMDKDGVVSENDFGRFITCNPHLLPLFEDPKRRVQSLIYTESSYESESVRHI